MSQLAGRFLHVALVQALMLLVETAILWPARCEAVQFRAILIGVDYPGGKPHDNNLSQSATALRDAMISWKNWTRTNIQILRPDSTADQFGSAITTTGQQLDKGDGLYIFYMGHSHQGGTNAGRVDEFEQSVNNWDEALHFQDGSLLSDDALAALLGQLPEGLKVAVTLGGCWSGGFWGGDDSHDPKGDLEIRPDTVLMYAAKEDQCVAPGRRQPRPGEPLYISNLIANADKGNRRQNLPIIEWHDRSAVGDAGRGGVFDAALSGLDGSSQPDEFDFVAESGIFYNDGADSFDLFIVPEPSGLAGFAVVGGLLFAGHRRRWSANRSRR